MADQERSGPTPAQEALARAMLQRLPDGSLVTEAQWAVLSRPTRQVYIERAQRVADAIAAGEVPGVFTADGEEWGHRVEGAEHVWPAPTKAMAYTRASIHGEEAVHRAVGPWVPADEEASDG